MSVLEHEKIVFLPGLDGTGISFEPIKALLPETVDITIVRYPNEKLSFEETIECAADQFPVLPSVVIAESFSGPVAIALIASKRISARVLVLAATFAKCPRPVLLAVGRYLPLRKIIGFPFPKMFLRCLLGDKESQHSLLPMWKRMQLIVPSEILSHRLKLVSHVDVTKRLSDIDVPCCYIEATDDLLVPHSALHNFVDKIPGLVIRNIKGPHFILQAQPAASLRVIEEFMDLVVMPIKKNLAIDVDSTI